MNKLFCQENPVVASLCLSVAFQDVTTWHGSSVGKTFAAQLVVLGLTLPSGVFFRVFFFSLPLIQAEQVVSY